LGIRLITGLGVEGDAHAGVTIQHRSRWAREKTAPNLRQVHLIHAELFEELRAAGLQVAPGQMGENITTLGVDLLSLPTDTRLRIGATAVIRMTGLRNPCIQLERLHKGLMAATLSRAPDGFLVRKAGVMAVVEIGGEVLRGDSILVHRPAGEERPLVPV
jgi:MOSC domain-containing protein YiiM